MSETVEHEALQHDVTKAAGEYFAQMNLQAMSFVQLRQLQKLLRRAVTEIDEEIGGRATADNFGDTVTVPSEKF